MRAKINIFINPIEFYGSDIKVKSKGNNEKCNFFGRLLK